MMFDDPEAEKFVAYNIKNGKELITMIDYKVSIPNSDNLEFYVTILR